MISNYIYQTSTIQYILFFNWLQSTNQSNVCFCCVSHMFNMFNLPFSSYLSFVCAWNYCRAWGLRLDLADLQDVKSFKNRFTAEKYGPWAGTKHTGGVTANALTNNSNNDNKNKKNSNSNNSNNNININMNINININININNIKQPPEQTENVSKQLGGDKIDVLMNNAGVMAIPERQETKDPKKTILKLVG